MLVIGGWGRCGSTLLDMMLGELDGFVSAGEVRELWLRGSRRTGPAGAAHPSAPVPSGPRWAPRPSAGGTGCDLARVLRVRYRRDRAWALPALLAGTRRRSVDGDLAHYLDALSRLVAGISSVAGARVVVDSSKLPSHTLLLQRAPGLDVRLVHLVRDSRGVAHSVRKHVVKTVSSGEPTLLPRHGAVAASLRYDLYNGVHHALEVRERRHGRRLLRVRYEDLVRDPERWLVEVARHARRPGTDRLPFLEQGQVRLAPNHLVDGNPVRFSHGAVRLDLDAAWHHQLGAGDRRIVTALTGPCSPATGTRSPRWTGPRRRPRPPRAGQAEHLRAQVAPVSARRPDGGQLAIVGPPGERVGVHVQDAGDLGRGHERPAALRSSAVPLVVSRSPGADGWADIGLTPASHGACARKRPPCRFRRRPSPHRWFPSTNARRSYGAKVGARR